MAAESPPGFRLLLRLLASNWACGGLTLRFPDGLQRRLEGRLAGPEAVLEIRSYRFAGRVLRGGDIGFAEGYMAGEWDSPDLALLLQSLADNYDHLRRLFDGNPLVNAAHWLGHRLARNTRRGSRRNIHAHYDLGNAFYASWLDETMTYSSARFDRPSQPLAEAQTAKYVALAEQMGLRSGHSVLEIGCGWGGFAEFAARDVGAAVTGITISREQYDFARRRLFEAGLADRAAIRLVDYRDIEGRFDRVASIEMAEAVGREYWPTYFSKIRSVLRPGGIAGLQVITIRDDLFDDYEARTDFIQKYIFPGGTLPSVKELAPVVSAAGLEWRGAERFGQDYARTLSCWSRSFEAAWPRVRRVGPGFDERFRRLWRFYLAYCEAGFRSGRTDVVQLTLQRP